MHALPVGHIVNALSGLLVITLGLFVASVRRVGGRGNRAFALFAVAFGAAFLVDNLTREAGHLATWSSAATGLLLGLAAAGLIRLVVTYPRSSSRLERAAIWMACSAAAFVLVGFIGQYDPGRTVQWGAMVDVAGVSLPLLTAGYLVFHSAAWGALFLLAFRHREMSVDDGARSVLPLLSGALVLYPAFYLGAFFPGLTLLEGGAPLWPLIFAILLLLAYAAAWVGSLRGTEPAAAAWIPAVAAGAALAGVLLVQFGWNNPGWGISRTLMVVVLAYAILRHQLLGIDVKVKWTLKQSTVAAVFIAVFFIVSEGAAALFEAQTGSTVAGILAAGGLVFAIAPLQRLAEKVADKAMPGVKAVGEMTADERHRAYEDAASTAWSDGAIDVNERVLLDRFRESLGLNEEEAYRIECEAAGEVH